MCDVQSGREAVAQSRVIINNKLLNYFISYIVFAVRSLRLFLPLKLRYSVMRACEVKSRQLCIVQIKTVKLDINIYGRLIIITSLFKVPKN